MSLSPFVHCEMDRFAARDACDPDPDEDAKADAADAAHKLRVASERQRFARLMRYLPETERKILEARRRGMKQREIGERLGLTQAGVSHRMFRAYARLEFIQRTDYPSLDLKALRRALGTLPGLLAHDADVLASFCTTSCQVATARECGVSLGRARDSVLRSLRALEASRHERFARFVRALLDAGNVLHEGIGAPRRAQYAVPNTEARCDRGRPSNEACPRELRTVSTELSTELRAMRARGASLDYLAATYRLDPGYLHFVLFGSWPLRAEAAE